MAYIWISLSGKQGYNQAQYYIDKISDKMSPDQLEDAEKRFVRLSISGDFPQIMSIPGINAQFTGPGNQQVKN
ncbi:MAG: hypothetical protein H7835_17120 [Magnetococcus sp. XQGC-1]